MKSLTDCVAEYRRQVEKGQFSVLLREGDKKQFILNK
jgi:hypothetical protein